MSNTIRIKRRATGLAGAPSVLKNAEIAFNEVDDVLYYGTGTDVNGDANTVISIGGPGAFVSLAGVQTITGNKTFSGSVALGSSATATTKSANDNSTSVATTAYVDSAVTGLSSTLTVGADVGSNDSVILGVDTLTFSGDTGITTTVSNNDISIDLDDTSVTPGGYGSASSVSTFTVDQQGRITAAGNTAISISSSAVSNFTEASQDVTGAQIATNGSHSGISATYDDAGDGAIDLSLTNTGVTASTYGDANSVGTFTVDAQGRITSASNTDISITSSQVSDLSTNAVTSLSGTTNEIEVNASTGSVQIGLPNSVSIASNLTVGGNLTVNGDTTTVNTSTLSVEDALIILANGNDTTDSVDIGFYGLYDTSGSQNLYAGLFRDASDGKFRLFKDLQSEPTTTVNTSGTGYSIASLVANLEGDVTGNASTATTLETARNINGVSFNGSADITVTAAAGTLTGTTLNSSVVTSSLTTVGTIGAGVWQGTAVGLAYGGTGATSAAGARSNLGLVIGTNVQAYDAELEAIAGLTSAADRVPYFTGSGTAALATLSSFGRTLIDDTSASTARTTLGLGTISTQNSNNVSITGGSIDNITFDGGTF